MSNMKCPFCQQGLREIYCYGVVMGYICPNPDCKKAEKLKGNAEFWQELIRTRKALEIVVDELKETDKLLSSNKFDVKEVPLLNITQTKISMLLKYINIEQKESAFVHNKIKFPEFNDNLLEEFDKQFFEDGQDDI